MSSPRAVKEEGTGPGEARPPKQVRVTTKVNQSAMEPRAQRRGARSSHVGWLKLNGLWPWSLVAAFIGPSGDASHSGLRFGGHYLETTSLLFLILLCGKSNVT